VRFCDVFGCCSCSAARHEHRKTTAGTCDSEKPRQARAIPKNQGRHVRFRKNTAGACDSEKPWQARAIPKKHGRRVRYRLIRPSHTIYHSVRIARFTERKVKNRNSLSGNSFADIHLDELKAYLLENVKSSNTLFEDCIVLLMREAVITTRTITKASDLHTGGNIAYLCRMQ
jgi:hypothetical protein